MKQLMPFLVIALLIGAVMYMMQDDYEGPDYADVKADIDVADWQVTYYINDIAKDEPVHGVEAEWTSEESIEGLSSLELFVVSSSGSFYMQDLDVNDFDGTIRHEEVCSDCNGQGEEINGRILINWSDQEQTEMEHENFLIEADE